MSNKGKPLSDVPAGDERREQERVNADELAQLAEEQNRGMHAIDPSKIEPDNEILGQIVNDRFNRMEVSDAQGAYVYCWIRAFTRDGRQDLEAVTIKQLAKVKNRETGRMEPCWHVVIGKTMPEAQECIDVYGYRRIGDSILMRCRRDLYVELERMEQEERDLAEGKLYEEFEENAHGVLGNAVRVSRFNSTANDWRRDRRQLARGAAMSPGGPMERMLKQGTVPGMRPGRV